MDNFDDDVVQGIVDLIERGRQAIQNRLKLYDPTIGPFTIFPGRKVPLAPLPAIEIVRLPMEQEWFATTVYGDKFPFNIDCSVQSLKETYGEKLASVFGRLILKWLNYTPNKIFLIPNSSSSVWDSQATGVDPNFRRGAGLRTARVGYWVKVLEPAISWCPDQ